MKRTQIEALLGAHRGRSHAVASLHILRQNTLDEDDQSFLREHADSLELGDLLRWLGRSSAQDGRGAILKILAVAAVKAPERFRFEVLGGARSSLDEHEWGELAALTIGQLKPEIEAGVWARVGGAPSFRALCSAKPWGPTAPLEPALFACERREGEILEERIRRAFEPKGVSLRVARELFELRYDEKACVRALAKSPPGVETARWLYELERAGLVATFDFSGLSEETTWACEERGEEDELVRQAYLRWVACALGGANGRSWLLSQIEKALARGVDPALLLGEVPREVRNGLPAALLERLRELEKILSLRAVLLLDSLVPGVVAPEALAQRIQRDAEEGDEDWGPLVLLLPGGFDDAVLQRIRRSRRGPELVALLDWLLAHGQARKKVLTLAVEALERGMLHRALVGWLADQLATRAAWEQSGAGVIAALVRLEALPELNDLMAMAWSQARRDHEDDTEPPEGFRQAVHCAFAEVLHEAIGEALLQGDQSRALLSASALACLDPPPRFRKRLQGGGWSASGSEEVEQILDMVRALTRHGGGRDASLRDVIAAVHALASLEEVASVEA